MRLAVLSVVPGRVVNGRFLTDRAKRYRAQANVHPQRRCFACGVRNPRTVHHIDGNESNGEQRNLTKACTSCNQRIANVMRKAGIGVRTRQYNPRRAHHAQPSLGAYLSSIAILKGEQPGNVRSAVKTVHETTPAQRSQFAEQIWKIRKERYGPTGRQDSLPF